MQTDAENMNAAAHQIRPEEIARNHGEVTFIEFRRRFDQVRAVRSGAEELWPEIDKLDADLKEAKKSRWLKFWGAVFFICLVIDWWIRPSGKSEFNTPNSIALFILIGYMGYLYDLSSKERSLKTMYALQRELLYKWEECGAQTTKFWHLKALHRQTDKLINSPDMEMDEWRIQLNGIEEKIEQFWREVQLDLVERAGADVPYDAYLK